MTAVPIETDPSFSPGNPTVLFESQGYIAAGPGSRAFDIYPDGQRFLMIKQGGQDEPAAANQIVVVQNWFEELKARVPTER